MDEGLLILDIPTSKQFRFVSRLFRYKFWQSSQWLSHARIILSGDTIRYSKPTTGGPELLISWTTKETILSWGMSIKRLDTTECLLPAVSIYKITPHIVASWFSVAETIDSSNPSKGKCWLNPGIYPITATFGSSWNGKVDGHCNEIAYSSAHQIFISGGDSDSRIGYKRLYHPKINGT